MSVHRTEVHHDSAELSVRSTFTGKLVVVVRYAVPDETPGSWEWGPWKPAGVSELGVIMALLTGREKK